MDIADPDRHFELVIPLIARSKAYILSAILALSARHLLSSAVPTPRPDRLWYLDELAAQVDSARVEGYVRECAPALQRLDAGFLDPDELEGIVVVAALLRQVELLERQATSSWSDAQSGSTGNLLPVVNNLLDSADFKTRFPHSGLVQAVYLMVLRQEVYHCLSSGERPAVSTVRCSPDISFIHETTIHMLEVLQLEGGAGVERDALLAQQDQLENSTLAGIQPIFQREPDRAAGDLLPLLWFNSRTEMYCIQLAKMARAILTFGGDGYVFSLYSHFAFFTLILLISLPS